MAISLMKKFLTERGGAPATSTLMSTTNCVPLYTVPARPETLLAIFTQLQCQLKPVLIHAISLSLFSFALPGAHKGRFDIKRSRPRNLRILPVHRIDYPVEVVRAYGTYPVARDRLGSVNLLACRPGRLRIR